MKSATLPMAILGLLLTAPWSLADPRGVGAKAPPIDLQTLLQAPPGTRANLNALRGKVVVLEFWATWCGTCVEDIPYFDALIDQLKGKPVQFISITDENARTVIPFLAHHPIRGWVGLNTTSSTFKRYGIEGRPVTVVIRPDGIVDARITPMVLPSGSFPITAQSLLNLAAGKPSGLVSSFIVYAGEVHNGQGKPIASVSIRATNRTGNDGEYWKMIGPDATTDQNGRFRMEFDLPLSYVDAYPVRLDFHHADYLYGRLEDLRLFPAEQQADLHVCLRDGASLSGRVVDEAGREAPGATVVAAFDGQPDYSKQVTTSPDGQFILRGLPAIETDLRIIDPRLPLRSGHLKVNLQLPENAAVVRLSPALPRGFTVHELFGIKFVDVDKALQTKLFLPEPYGILVLDPGPHSERLGLDKLNRGDSIVAIGDEQPGLDFMRFASVLLAGCDNPHRGGRIFVRMGLPFDPSTGSGLWPITLSRKDLSELRHVVRSGAGAGTKP